MKANEAPNKIWLIDEWVHQFDNKDFIDEDSIEYTRTDAFIEKACEWLEPVLTNYAGYYIGKDILGDFKNYMKGE